MKNLKRILGLLAALPVLASANTVGVSAQPFGLQNKMLTTEFTSNLSSGSGYGFQGRYVQKVNQNLKAEAGFGISSGERDSRIMVGADYMLYPDYGRQPRVSVKGTFERLREFGNTVNALGITPTVSKGVSISGHEAFPFVALPIKLGLDSDTKRYETISSLAVGITGRLPIEGYRHLVGNLEANIDISNSFTGLYMGVGYPL